MRTSLTALGLMLAASAPASAEEDVAPRELGQMIRGKAVTLGSDRVHYGADGFSKINDARPGRYRVEGSSICIRFESGSGEDVCDRIRKTGDNYVLITNDGVRHPFDPK